MYIVLQAIFSVLLAVIGFFTNTFAFMQKTSEVPDGAVRVSYGDKACEKMDIYIPEGKSGEADVLMLIHGGAWVMGDTTMFSRESAEAVKEDYVVVSIDYQKLTGGANALDMVDEVGAAIAKTDSFLESKGIDADKIAIIGHSAGAHIALLYSYTHYDSCPIDIAFVMGNSTPADFINIAEDDTTTVGSNKYAIASVLSGKVITKRNHEEMSDASDSISPTAQVTSSVPPTLLVHGAKDRMVPYSNSVDLYARLQTCGVDSEFITYPDADHFLMENPECDEIRAESFREFAERYF